MKNKIKERSYHLMLILFLAGFFIGLNSSYIFSAGEQSFKYLDYFHGVYKTINEEYVEQAEPKTLFYGAIRGMLSSLSDPYSRFLDEEDYSEFHEQVTGEIVGIGVEITVVDDEIIVIAPIEDSPAEKAGVMPGDKIIRVDEAVVRGKNINEVIKNIRGKPSTKTKIYIMRDGFPEPIELEIARSQIKVHSVKTGIIEEGTVCGYLKITNFYEDTYVEVEKALASLNAKHINKLILDLRDNPGGNLDTSIRIADYFLPKDKVIVSTRGKEGSGVVEEYKSKTDEFYNGKIIMLVNGGSASASEILAGALKDNDRAKLLGEKTFGKALVQRIIDIEPKKLGFALTIRKYYTPSGAMIHKTGITPDYVVVGNIIPEADRKNLGRIFNDKLINEFSLTNKEYNEKSVMDLMGFLNSKNLPVSKTVAAYYFKQQISKNKVRPLYDLEDDIQLKEAINKLK